MEDFWVGVLAGVTLGAAVVACLAFMLRARFCDGEL
jgi:hypothetical protein